MILGLDHIALSANDLTGAADDLISIGFQTLFACEGLPNPIGKRPFLRRLDPCHDIGQYRAKTGASFEITVHAPIEERAPAGYSPICAIGNFQAPIKSVSDREDIGTCIRAAFGSSAEPVDVVRGVAECWIVPSEAEGLLGAARVVADLNAMRSLLTRGFGLCEAARGENCGRRWSVFQFAGPVKQWHGKLLFVEGAQPAEEKDYLDDPGCPCVALLSSDLPQDLARLSTFVEDIERFQLQVGLKTLDIALMRGPSGEIWELIDPRNKARP